MRASDPRSRVTVGTYDWFLQETARFLSRLDPKQFNFGASAASLRHSDKEVIHQFVQQGEHEFYHASGYDWLFLRPEYSLSLVADTEDYTADDDFGGILTPKLVYVPDDNTYACITKVTPQVIRARRSTNTSLSSFPQLFAEEAKTTDGTGIQNYSIMVWPTPDAAYTVKGQYRVEPVYMSASRQYPYGGAAVQQVLLQAIKAVAEQDVTGRFGVQTERYRERLAEAIARESRTHGPSVLGYNGNGSGNHSGLLRNGRYFENFSNATYAGTDYGG